MEPLVRAEHLTKSYPVARKRLIAVREVSLELVEGEMVGLVGESGCGKSTLGRCLLGLEHTDAGKVFFEGQELTAHSPRSTRVLRRKMQMILQDPVSALNPRMTVLDIVSEPLVIGNRALVRRKAHTDLVVEALRQVGLGDDILRRYPHEFSGGQRQRIAVARALVARPRFIVADEPVSALDAGVQAQIINLITEAQEQTGSSWLLISHNMKLVLRSCHRVVIMYLGRIVESGPSPIIAGRSLHPYTIALLAATPPPDPAAAEGAERFVLSGEVPSALAPPSGCPFHPRCPTFAERGDPVCASELPGWTDAGAGQWVACHEARKALDQSTARR